jgi:phosphoglycolate phosphatase
MTAQLLIFDLDGTLIDSRADLTAGINHMRCHFGLAPLPRETVSGYIGDGVRKLVERSLQGTSVDFEEALLINKEYYYSHLTVDTHLYEGVDKGIRTLSDAGHVLAVVTNKPGDPSREILKYFGLTDFFSAIIGGGDVAGLKPEPDGILECLRLTGAESGDTWMIGDHHTDLAAAKNAEVKSAFAQYGFGHGDVYEANAFFASFSELVGYFVGP